MNNFYKQNKDFRAYVDGYCRSRCISVEVALNHALIKQVYHYYKAKEADNESIINLHHNRNEYRDADYDHRRKANQ